MKKIKDLFTIQQQSDVSPLRSFIIESLNETVIANINTPLYEYLDKNQDKLLALDTYTEGDPVVATDSIAPDNTKNGKVTNKGETTGELKTDFEDGEYDKPEHHPTRKDAIANESIRDHFALTADSELHRVCASNETDASKELNETVTVVFPLNYDVSNLSEESEDHLTNEQIKKREEIVLALKKNKHYLQKRYGDRWEAVMYAIATKKAKET